MEDFVHMITALLLFLVAAEICFAGCKQVCDIAGKRQMKYSDIVMFEMPVSDKELIWDGETVLAKLCSPAQMDIWINHLDETEITIRAGIVGITVLQNADRLADALYRINYIYDANGRSVGMNFVEIEAGST